MASLSAFVVRPKDVKFDSQEGGEEILFLLRRHGVTNFPWIFLSGFLFLSPIIFLRSFDLSTLLQPVPREFFSVVITFWYLITVGYAFEGFLNWYFNVNIVTNKRIIDIDFWGILYRRVSELEYANVEDVTYAVRGLAATIFNYGSVFIQTAGEKQEFEFQDIPNPNIIHDKITDLVRQT